MTELAEWLSKNGRKTMITYGLPYDSDTIRDSNIFQDFKPLTDSITAVALEYGLSPDEAQALVAQIKSLPHITATDHHGFIGDPYFFTNTLLELYVLDRAHKPFLIVFSCATVPLDNSTNPGGFTYFEADQKKTVSLFSLKEAGSFVLTSPGVTQKKLESIQGIPDLFRTLIEKSFDAVSFGDGFARQAFDFNRRCIKEILPDIQTQYSMLPIEEIAAKILLDFHLAKGRKEETIISRILCDEKIRQVFISCFDGIDRNFNSTSNKGSHFFWHIKNNSFYRTTVVDGALRSEEGLNCPLDEQHLQQALKKGMLIPTFAWSLVILSFYHGLKLAGGVSQFAYFQKMFVAYEKFSSIIGGIHLPVTLHDCSILRGDYMASSDTKNPLTLGSMVEEKLTAEDLAHIFESTTIEEGLKRMETYQKLYGY